MNTQEMTTCGSSITDKELLEAIRQNFTDLSNKVSELQTDKNALIEKLMVLEATGAQQENEILNIRNQTEQNEKDFALLARRLTEEYQILNSSHVEVVLVVETVQKTIATNTLQIEILNSTFIDAHNALRVDLNATILERERILSQLSSVNRSLEQNKQDTEELREEASRNNSALTERIQRSIDDVRSEVATSTDEVRSSLNSRMDELEGTQASQRVVQDQHDVDIRELKWEVSDIKSSGSGLVASGVVILCVTVLVILY